MAAGLTDLDSVHAAAAEGADLVHLADPALIAAIRAARPDLGVSMAFSSAAAAESGAGLICALPEVGSALAAGVDPARILVELGPGPDFARRPTDLVATGWPVLVSDPALSDPALSGQAGQDPAGAAWPEPAYSQVLAGLVTKYPRPAGRCSRQFPDKPLPGKAAVPNRYERPCRVRRHRQLTRSAGEQEKL